MRIFLIIFSFINTIFYILIYSYFDKVLEILEGVNLPPVAANYIKLAALLIAGFCIGVMAMLILRLKLKKSFFSFKNFFLLGTVPLIFIILSEGTVTGFIINKLFNSSETVSELAFYLLSNQSIWFLWLGFAAGSSLRLSIYRRVLKHVAAGAKESKSPKKVERPDTENKDHNHPPEYQ